jgi:hypothetical protein
MKNSIVLIAAVVLVYVIGQYAKQVYQYKKYRSCVEEINLLLEDAKQDSSKLGKIFKANDFYLEKAWYYQKLFKKGIVGSNTEIYYKSKDCICLINKANPSFDNTFSVTDYIVIRNENIGFFSNGLDDLYSMNQVEGQQNLQIEAFQLDTETNLFIIKH